MLERAEIAFLQLVLDVNNCASVRSPCTASGSEFRLPLALLAIPADRQLNSTDRQLIPTDGPRADPPGTKFHLPLALLAFRPTDS